MNSKNKNGRVDDGATILGPVNGETLLRYEIGFWRDLLSTDAGSSPPESLERMRQALALAERRLLDWYAESTGPDGSSDGRGRTSSDGMRPLD